MSSADRRHVVVATHGHCFDGMCSAVMFTRLLRHVHRNDELRFSYHAAGYGPGQNGVDPKVLVGDVNAILDFRFSALPALGWYFDHHVSAFPTEADRAAYDAHVRDRSPADRRMFHDGSYGSCTKLIADVGVERFGLDPSPTADLVRWADIIDSAAFPNAAMAVARTEPELQLMTVIERLGDDAFLARYVPRLLEQPLRDVACSTEIQSAYGPMKRELEAFSDLVRQHATVLGPVVFVDLTSDLMDVAPKFVTYALHPESAYSVLVTRSKTKCKISVGFNPWGPIPRRHDIAALCQRYGGGGHPVVGAVSIAASDVEGARRIAHEIAEELSS